MSFSKVIEEVRESVVFMMAVLDVAVKTGEIEFDDKGPALGVQSLKNLKNYIATLKACGLDVTTLKHSQEEAKKILKICSNVDLRTIAANNPGEFYSSLGPLAYIKGLTAYEIQPTLSLRAFVNDIVKYKFVHDKEKTIAIAHEFLQHRKTTHSVFVAYYPLKASI